MPNTITHTTNNVIHIIYQMFDTIPGLDWHQKLFFLNNCNCCKRHQIKKPYIFKPWVDTHFTIDNNHDDNCTCKCRHAARMICRQCPDNDTDIVPLPNSPRSIII